MAYTPKAMSRGLLTNSSATLYAVPAATTAVVTNILLTNTSASTVTVTISFDGVAVLSGQSLAGNSVMAFDLRQALAATKLVTGLASVTSVVACHISGAEVA